MPRLRGATPAGVHPGSEERHCGIPLELRACEQGKPTLDDPDPPDVAGRHGECGDEASGAIQVAGRGGLHDRRLRIAVGLVPIGSQSTQSADSVGLMPFELADQHVPEKAVVAVRVARPVERHDKEVRVVERLQRPGRATPLEHRVAQRTVHRVEDRRSHQERALVVLQAGKALGSEIVGQIPVVAREIDVSRIPDRERGQVEARRPPFGTVDQLGDLIVSELDPGGSQEAVGFAAAESDQVGPDLEQAPLRTDRRDRKGERAAARERERRMRRDVLREDAENLGRRRRDQP